MRAIKVLLSIVALVVGAVSTAMIQGLFNVSPALIAVITAAGAMLGYFGASPLALSVTVSKALGGVFMFLTALTGYHASTVGTTLNLHPWLWHLVGGAGILAGVLSRGPNNPSPPAVPAKP